MVPAWYTSLNTRDNVIFCLNIVGLYNIHIIILSIKPLELSV